MNGAKQILVAGLPKTGTTALAASISGAVGGATAFEPRAPEQVAAVEDCRVVKVVYAPHERRTLAEVMDSFDGLSRRIWIVRDPRDQLVSAYLYTWFRGHRMPEERFRVALDLVRRREAGEPIPFREMLRSTFGPDTYIHEGDYLGRRVMSFVGGESAKGVLFFRYSDLVAGRFGEVCSYLGVEIAAREVDAAYARVVRTRGEGGWRSWFTPEDRAWGEGLFGAYMRATGQAEDWACSDTPPDPRYGSWYMCWLWAGGTGPRPESEAACQALIDSVASAG